MTDGWVKIHRQLEDNPLWLSEPFTRGQAWVDLLLMANHGPRTLFVRGNRVQIERGQVGRSLVSLSQRWQWSKGKVLAFLDTLQKAGMADRRKSNVLAVLTIKNYDKYQSTGPQNEPQIELQNDRRMTAERPQNDPNKKEKNGKNERTYDGVRPETKALHEYIDSLCQQYRVKNAVSPRALDIQVERHLTTGIHLRVEVRKCIGWLIDKGKREVSTQRLTNWFEKAKEIQKREQTQSLERREKMNEDAALHGERKTPFAIDPAVKARLLSQQPNA